MYRHKFTLFVSVDGNFRLQRKRKNDDPEDFALNGGRAYFVEDEQYQQYLQFVDKPKEVRPNSSGNIPDDELTLFSEMWLYAPSCKSPAKCDQVQECCCKRCCRNCLCTACLLSSSRHG